MQPWRNRQPVANHGQRGIDRRIFKYHLCHDTCFAKTPENGVAKGAIRRQEAQSQWAPCRCGLVAQPHQLINSQAFAQLDINRALAEHQIEFARGEHLVEVHGRSTEDLYLGLGEGITERLQHGSKRRAGHIEREPETHRGV